MTTGECDGAGHTEHYRIILYSIEDFLAQRPRAAIKRVGHGDGSSLHYEGVLESCQEGKTQQDGKNSGSKRRSMNLRGQWIAICHRGFLYGGKMTEMVCEA